MTLDELKAEAKRQGYKLIKNNPMLSNAQYISDEGERLLLSRRKENR